MNLDHLSLVANPSALLLSFGRHFKSPLAKLIKICQIKSNQGQNPSWENQTMTFHHIRTYRHASPHHAPAAIDAYESVWVGKMLVPAIDKARLKAQQDTRHRQVQASLKEPGLLKYFLVPASCSVMFSHVHVTEREKQATLCLKVENEFRNEVLEVLRLPAKADQTSNISKNLDFNSFNFCLRSTPVGIGPETPSKKRKCTTLHCNRHGFLGFSRLQISGALAQDCNHRCCKTTGSGFPKQSGGRTKKGIRALKYAKIIWRPEFSIISH